MQDASRTELDEIERLKQMIDSRYEEIKSGRVTLVDGEEAFASLREFRLARRKT